MVISNIESQLSATTHVIERIRAISGNVGLSVGVIHQGQVVHIAHHGQAHLSPGSSPTNRTIYPVASLTKAMLASILANSVEARLITWSTPISSLIPEFRTSNPNLSHPDLENATIVDLLSHRLGLINGDNWWKLKQNLELLGKAETARTLAGLPKISERGEKWIYSNWSYALLGNIVEQITGKRIDQVMTEVLFEPLGMRDTFLRHPDPWIQEAEGDEKVVRARKVASNYLALAAGGHHQVPRPAHQSDSAFAGAGAVKSSLEDLLKYYQALLKAAKGDLRAAAPHTFTQIPMLWNMHSQVNADTGYGLGWFLSQLPGRITHGLTKQTEVEKLPITAQGTDEQRLVYHSGSCSGGGAMVYLLPDTETAVIVLANSLDLVHTPSIVGKVLLEATLDVKQELKVDWAQIAQEDIKKEISAYDETRNRLSVGKSASANGPDLEPYAGYYVNSLGNFTLEVQAKPSSLLMIPQGYEQSAFELYHHHDHTYYWHCDRDDESREAMYPVSSFLLHLVSFEMSAGRAVRLRWAIHGDDGPQEVFRRFDE